MKTLKKIFAIIASIIVLLLLSALFVKKEYSVQRQISINKPNEHVFNYVKYQKNQEHYNKWVMADPKLKKTYKGSDGTVGFIYAWDSEKTGKGEQEIKAIKYGEAVNSEIRFAKPFEGIAHTEMKTKPESANQTTVSWLMEGRSNYPMNIMNLFIDKVLGGDLETSLQMLKHELEKS